MELPGAAIRRHGENPHASRQLDAAGAALTNNYELDRCLHRRRACAADGLAELASSPEADDLRRWHGDLLLRTTATDWRARSACGFAGRPALDRAVPTGQSYDNPRHFSAYERIGKLLDLPDERRRAEVDAMRDGTRGSCRGAHRQRGRLSGFPAS